ncbi:MAG TPA: DUF664 domain-containing protein [Actinomycetes bacterium]
MTSADILVDAFGRVREVVHRAVAGLTAEQLAFRPEGRANSIAWLVWHLTRVQDDHVADAAGTEQVWTVGGWADRLGLPFAVAATGYGQSSDEVGDVGKVRLGADLLTGYHDAVHARTVEYVEGLTDDDLTRVVDEAWDPPVTLGVRLVSVISDDLQHAGQAAYLRGLVER